MGYFSISSVDERSVTIWLSPLTNYPYYRVFIRKSSETGATVDQIFALSEGQYLWYPGLEPETNYTINVEMRPSQSANGTWMGAQTFTTVSSYSVTVYYDANGGSGAPASHTATNSANVQPVTLSTAVPTKNGAQFLGWATDPNATAAQFSPGGTYYFTSGAIYLYAVWGTGGGGGGTSGGGGCRVWTGSGFTTATPYIWTGATWVKATPYVWTGTMWRQCK